ncbi:MAG: carbon storage regulator CsrA [Candidatus Paracaedibacteraceae bacterium]|jgi:carbon storage regulator|nr:carbon storage regulator CsrA [Candidatus Paracaedibacteraceae bacterium]
MLFLTRKVGESIIINDDITLTVSEIRGSIVKLSFDYEKSNRILRKEIYDRIQDENRQAAAKSDDVKEMIKSKVDQDLTVDQTEKKTAVS